MAYNSISPSRRTLGLAEPIVNLCYAWLQWEVRVACDKSSVKLQLKLKRVSGFVDMER